MFLKSKYVVSAFLFTGAIAGLGLIRAAGAKPASAPVKYFPIVDVQTGYLLGATTGRGKWVDPEKLQKKIPAGTNYQIYSAALRLGVGRGGAPASQGAPCEDTQFVKLTLPPRVKDPEGWPIPSPTSSHPQIALAAPWNALPRVPMELNPGSMTYNRIVGEWLTGKGLKNPKVRITQLWQVDLEGDGQKEVLVSATTHDGGAATSSLNPRTKIGDYSIVLLRKVVNGKVVTLPLEQEYYTKAHSFAAPNTYTVVGTLDLDGDGKLEVITRGRYYEGDWVAVYQIGELSARKPLLPKPILAAGCGA